MRSNRLEYQEMWYVNDDYHPDEEKREGIVSTHTSPRGWIHWQSCINERVKMDRREGFIWFWGITATAVTLMLFMLLLYYNSQTSWDNIDEQRATDQAKCEYVIDSGQPEVIIDSTC